MIPAARRRAIVQILDRLVDGRLGNVDSGISRSSQGLQLRDRHRAFIEATAVGS